MQETLRVFGLRFHPIQPPAGRSRSVFAIATITLLFLVHLQGLYAQQNTNTQESQVIGLLKSLDSACLRKDARSMCSNFTDNASITIVLYEDGEKYTDTYDKKKYQSIIESGFPSYDDYTAERSGTQVRIAADGNTATAKSIFVESFRRNGTKMKCVSEEHYVFVLIDGKILIKTMSNVAKMQ